MVSTSDKPASRGSTKIRKKYIKGHNNTYPIPTTDAIPDRNVGRTSVFAMQHGYVQSLNFRMTNGAR